MNELGEENDVLHEMIGEVVMEYTDFLITVGDDAKLIAKKALEKGGNRGAVHSYGSAAEAAKFFKKEVKKGDVILVKGSQNKVMLERFVKALMKNPEDAKRLLVRQEKVWNTKP
jgi:UDP-N-acetylmuramyl pentapeptide synthase